MPITPTYPGIYIEELPSSARTITPAPTSIAVFVGYTHPFKTRSPNKPVRLFGFGDYEREFGGFFVSDAFDSDAARDRFGSVAHAVNQFFLNGGSECWVVGLVAMNADGSLPEFLEPASLDVAGGAMRFVAREPTDTVPMRVTLSNLPAAGARTTADVTVTYGAKSEVFRQVNLNAAPGTTRPAVEKQNFVARLNDRSSLVRVEPTGAGGPDDFGAEFPAPAAGSTTLGPLTLTTPAPPAGPMFAAADFANAFRQDGDLDKLPVFNLLVLPGVTDNGVLSEALRFCERKMAFLIMDPPRGAVAAPAPARTAIEDVMADAVPGAVLPKEKNGALYFPYLRSNDPAADLIPRQERERLGRGPVTDLPPSGTVAGIFARTDVNRGVWKAPAGLETTVRNATGVVEDGRMTEQRHGVLNPAGVNVLREFPGVGTVVFGARTLVTANPSQQQWRYVPVRRMALFLEQTLYRNLGWVVFEPNDEPLWLAIRNSIETFMLGLFRQGAFQGATPGEAFQVKCDHETTTQADVDNGIVNIVVAFAPLKPAEFVIVKIAQLAGQTQQA